MTTFRLIGRVLLSKTDQAHCSWVCLARFAIPSFAHCWVSHAMHSLRLGDWLKRVLECIGIFTHNSSLSARPKTVSCV